MRAYDGIKAERGREVNLETPDFVDHARQLLSRNIPIEIRMSGGSMRPSIEDGDQITIEPLTDQLLKPGDIILYQTRFDTAVIHRVVRFEKVSAATRMVVTRGDASSLNDIPVPIEKILGRVKHVERAGERIKMSKPKASFGDRLTSFWNRLKTWLGR